MALELGRQTIMVAAMLSAPILLVAVVVGLTVTVIQTVTSIQEQTLIFVVKMASVLAVTLALLPWLIQTLCQFTAGLLNNLNHFAH